MELFQILGGAAMLTTAGYFAYKAFNNRYFETSVDKFGRTRKRDIRNGRFVKAN
jgi:hypothetical protein